MSEVVKRYFYAFRNIEFGIKLNFIIFCSIAIIYHRDNINGVRKETFTMKKTLAIVMALVMSLACFAFAQAEPIVLNMGILDGWTGFPTKYIVDNGLDVAAGIDIEYLVFSSGQDLAKFLMVSHCFLVSFPSMYKALYFSLYLSTPNLTISRALSSCDIFTPIASTSLINRASFQSL